MNKEKEGEVLSKNGFYNNCQFLPKSRAAVFSEAKKRDTKGLYIEEWGTPT